MKAFLACVIFLAVNGLCHAADDQCTKDKINDCYNKVTTGLASKDQKQICKALQDGETCDKLLAKGECKDFKTKLGIEDSELEEEELSLGCDGDCGKVYGKCLSDVASFLSGTVTYNLEFCTKVTKGLTCLKTAGAGVCNDKIKTLVGKLAVATKAANFSDYCDADGKPTKCLQTFQECEKKLEGIDSKSSEDEACSAISKYFKCESGVSCVGTLKEARDTVDAKLKAAEVSTKCPTSGSCNDRLKQCGDALQTKMKAIKGGTDDDATKTSKLCTLTWEGYNCFDIVRSDPTCSSKANAISALEKQITSDKADCGDNPLTCSENKVNACLTTIKDGLTTKDDGSVQCTALQSGEDCVDVLAKGNCQAFKTKFNILDTEIDNAELKAGCEGDCGKAYGKCLDDVSVMLSGKVTYNLEFCQKVTKGLNCLKKIKSDSCSKTVTMIISNLAVATKAANFSDFCDDNGNQSPCLKQFNECSQNLEGVTSKTNDKDACLAASKYFECERGSTCKSALKEARESVRTQLIAAERKSKCPTQGSCNERMAQCGTDLANQKTSIYESDAEDSTKKKQYCGLVKTAFSCIDFVRKDKVCIVEAAAAKKIETALQAATDDDCGASSLIISTTLIALGVVFSSLKNYF